MRNSRFPGCNRNRENLHGPNRPHRRPYRRASTPQDRLRHSRRQAQGLRRPGAPLRPQTLLRPFPTSGRPSLEDPRRRSRYERGRSAVECRANPRRDPARRGPTPRSRRDPLRGRRRDRVRTIPAALEVGNAGCQPVLPEEPDPAPLPGTASRRHRPAGRPGLVRIAARDPGRRRPLNAGALRHLEGSGSHGSSAAGLQPLPGHPTLSPQGARALPVRRGDTPPVGETVGPRKWASAAGRRHPAPPADGMPQERDPDAPLVRLPRGSPLPPRQQDWAPHRLAVAARPKRSRRAGPDRAVGVPGAARPRAEEQGLARRVLGHGSCRSRVARRAPPRSPSHPCQHRSAAGRDRADHRQAARSPQSRNHAQVHPPTHLRC